MTDFSKLFPAEIVSVQGKPYIISDIRVERASLPEGLYAYDVGDDSSDGEFWRIKPYVRVDYWCTVIGKEPIELGTDGVYWCPEDPENEKYSSEGWFLGEGVDSLEEYMAKYGSLKAEASS